MDTRVDFIETRESGRLRILALGRYFNDMQSAQKFVEKAIERREKLAGRTLTRHELLYGVEHADDRDDPTRQRDEQWRPTPFKLPDDEPRHPVADDSGFLSTRKKETRKDLRRRAIEDYDRRVNTEAAKSKYVASDEHEGNIDAAIQLWETAAFDQTQPRSTVEMARQAVQQAEHCPKTFRKMTAAVTTKIKTHYEQRRASAIAALAEAQAAVDSIPVPPQPLVIEGLPANATARRMKTADGVESIDVLGPEENGARRLLASYPIDQAPPELLQAAT